MAIYFIQASDGAVKIGRAINVHTRMSNLQTAHAKELVLLRSIEGGAVEEWECQYAFKEARIRGEWFEFREEMMTFQPLGRSKISLLQEYRKRRESSKISIDDNLVSFVRDCVRRHTLKQKDIARLMNLSPSSLSRKLAQAPDDTHRFTLDDLECYIRVTGDIKPIIYLIEKYLAENDESMEQLQAQLKGRRR
jgi:hypothetical protein